MSSSPGTLGELKTEFGFKVGVSGAHAARTMMLADLNTLLGAAPEAPHDLFVRWKPLDQQPIGWYPDLNDGVRLNIRPFMEADLSAAVPAGGQGQAGVLRKRPNLKWGIDRGKNSAGSPWGEERDNDRHLTLVEKRRAREK